MSHPTSHPRHSEGYSLLRDLALTIQSRIDARQEARAVKLGRAVRIPISEMTRLGLDIPAYLTGRGEDR